MSPLDAALTMLFPNNMQRDTTRLKCCACRAKWRWRSLKRCLCHGKMELIAWKGRKSIAPVTQNDCRHVCGHVRTSGSTMLATTLQPAWKPSKRRAFAASPKDTATAEEIQRIETRHVGASKRAFRARRPSIFTLCSFKIDVFLRVFLRTSKFATSKSMFRARLPSIFSTSHKMPRLQWNLHLVTTSRSPDNAIRKKRATRHV